MPSIAPELIAPLIDQIIPEDAAWSFAVPAGTFADVDGDTLVLSAALASGDPLPAWLAFDAGTGTFSGTPPADFNGALDLRVTASDGTLSVDADFTLTIDPVNDAPVVAAAIPAQVSAEDAAWSFAVPVGTFADVDGDTLVLSAALASGDPLPAWLGFDAGTGTFSGTPPADFHGALDLRVTASDGTLSASMTASRLTIDPVNDAPVVAAAIPAQSSAEDAAWSFAVPAGTFADVDGDTLVLSAVLASGDPLPSWLAFDAGTGTFSGTPPADFHGALTLRVTASDGTLSVDARLHADHRSGE